MKGSLQTRLRGRVRRQLSDLISRHAATLTPTERQIAQQLLDDPVTSGFMSASELARDLGVSASTVVRFAQSLGFGGWLELQGTLKHESSEWQRLVDMAPAEGQFLTEFINTELDNLRFMLGQDGELDQAAELLAGADRIWILGSRAASFVAGMAHHFFSMTRPGVHLLGSDARITPDGLLDLQDNQAAFVICMSRYARATVELARFLARKVPLVLLTDEFASPLGTAASVTLRFGTAGVTSWKSSTAAYTMTQALVMAVARSTPGARERLQRAEHLWNEFSTYHQEAT